MPPQVDRFLDRLSGWLLPPRCVLCRGRGQPPVLDLCRDCADELPALENPCPRCALPREPDDAAGPCGKCRGDPLPFERCLALFEYAFPIDRLVQSLKYQGDLATSRVLGSLLGNAAVERRLQLDVDLLLPVPLHPARLAERGFNQSLEIARWTARYVRRPVAARAMSRTRPTPAQVGLSLAERRTNLAGAFAVDESVRGRRIVLVDDVVTTGSTVREAAASLRAAGARSVDVWCIARTID